MRMSVNTFIILKRRFSTELQHLKHLLPTHNIHVSKES